MTDITTEYLSDLDLESLPVGTTIKCTKGVQRGQGYDHPITHMIQKASEATQENIEDFNLPKMTELTFDQGDERALAFIDTEEIIKHLEDLGYQVIDKSEHGDVLEQLRAAQRSAESYKAVWLAQQGIKNDV